MSIKCSDKITRDIYFRVKHGNPDVVPKLLLIQAILISNDFYCNVVASAYELTKGYIHPFSGFQLQKYLPKVELLMNILLQLEN